MLRDTDRQWPAPGTRETDGIPLREHENVVSVRLIAASCELGDGHAGQRLSDRPEKVLDRLLRRPPDHSRMVGLLANQREEHGHPEHLGLALAPDVPPRVPAADKLRPRDPKLGSGPPVEQVASLRLGEHADRWKRPLRGHDER